MRLCTILTLRTQGVFLIYVEEFKSDIGVQVANVDSTENLKGRLKRCFEILSGRKIACLSFRQ